MNLLQEKSMFDSASVHDISDHMKTFLKNNVRIKLFNLLFVSMDH